MDRHDGLGTMVGEIQEGFDDHGEASLLLNIMI